MQRPTRTVVLVAMILALLAVGGFFGYRWYDAHHISSDLRRILLAVMDSNATDADRAQYMREARLTIRTHKDEIVLGELEQAVHILEHPIPGEGPFGTDYTRRNRYEQSGIHMLNWVRAQVELPAIPDR